MLNFFNGKIVQRILIPIAFIYIACFTLAIVFAYEGHSGTISYVVTFTCAIL